MVVYCTTKLQGNTCTDSHCPYRHDGILRCEPCGRSFPAALLEQHQNGKRHQLLAIASNVPLDTRNDASQPTSSPPVSLSPRPSPPLTYSSPPKRDTSVPSQTEDPLVRVTVSHEHGLDFIVEGTGTARDSSFPSTTHTVFVENINPSSSLSVLALNLESPSSPCFTASLVGGMTVVHPDRPCKVLVSFQPSSAGNFHATLSITFSYKAGRDDEVFVVTRELRGRAIPPVPDNNKEPPNTITVEEDRMGDEGRGITVSHDSGLEFFVEHSQPDELFAPQTKELVITKSSVNPLVCFKAARVCSSDDSVASWLSAQLQGDSKWITYNRQRIVTVCFTPQREGFYEATLELTFCDHKRKADFVIKRTLSGRAEPRTDGDGQQQNERALDSSSQSINDGADDHPTTFIDNEEYLDSDGTGISVSHEDGLLDFGIVEHKRPKGLFATPSASLTIQLAEGFPAVTLIKERITSCDGSNLDFAAIFEGDSRHIRPGTESTVLIIFSPKSERAYKATLELVFYHKRRSARFVVRRELQGIARLPGEGARFDPFNKVNGTIRVLHPACQRKLKKIPEYEVPPIIRDVVDKSTDTHPYDKNASDLVFALRPDHLNINTYAHYFKALLNIEDGHQEWEALCKPHYVVEVNKTDKWYNVEIKDDDEDCLPEVAVGELVWLDSTLANIRYEACVTDVDVRTGDHAVLRVSLRLPADCYSYRETRFVLGFRHNRLTLRRQYHALGALLSPSRRLLFPSVSDIKPMRQPLLRADISNLKSYQLVNQNIRDDDQQLQAVVSILEQPQGSVPFIIYGPPGTGKTSVVVECIVQLVRRDVAVRVLVCTPSDAATDLLAKRLTTAGLGLGELYRLSNTCSREDDIPVIPKRTDLLAFRVVLSTCSSASILKALNVPIGHFSHIVVDEAAQAEEPLVMIPIMSFSDASTNIILAGDLNQLGPVIKSPTASKAGLGMSYLQRLMLMDEVYGLDTRVGETIVDLRRNYRSHDAIIAFSNQYLYGDTIRDYGNAYITYNLVHSGVLPKKGFPVVFHGVDSSEEHKDIPPSSVESREALTICDYCVGLTRDPQRKIYPDEIGILAPCNSQVRAIRESLKTANLSGISVGPVELFQGQERKVIILAATLSNASHLRQGLGFLMDRQRMNVAITRAQALLIVVGDPDVLGEDELWRTFLDYIKSRGGWTGKKPNWASGPVVPLPGHWIAPRKRGVLCRQESINRTNGS